MTSSGPDQLSIHFLYGLLISHQKTTKHVVSRWLVDDDPDSRLGFYEVLGIVWV